MKQRTKMKLDITNDPIWKLLIHMTFPMIFGMLGLVAFNIADTYYVTKLGLNQMAAMTFTFPVVMIVGSLAQGIGLGSAALISKAQGQNDKKQVTRYATDSLLLGLLLVFIFVVVGFFTINPLFTLLGADETTLPYVREYMKIWYGGVIFLVVPMIGNSSIRAIGDTRTPAIIMSFSALINIILDPLLIFGPGPFPSLGIQGAAIATVIARAFTLIFSFYIQAFRFRIISLKGVSIQKILSSFKDLLFIGLPNAVTRIMTPLAVAAVTGLIASFGKEATAGFGIASKIEPFAMIIINSMVSIYVPLLGQNLGAKKTDRVHEIIKKSSIFSMVYGGFIMILLMVFGGWIAGLFTDIPEVIKTVQTYLFIVPICYGIQGLFLVQTSTLNVLNKPILSALFSVLRLFALYVPLSLILSGVLELSGIWIAMNTSYLIVVIALGFILKRQLKH